MEERRRRKIILTSLILFTVLFFGFMMITRIADTSDFSKQQSPSGKESCSTAPKHPQDRRKDKTKFSFMNYNAEWLFLNGGSGSMKCPGTCTWKNDAEAIEHFKNIVGIVKMYNPDVIHFSEVEGCKVLSKFSNEFDFYKHYLVKGTDVSTGQQVGLVTKIDPIIDLKRTNKRFDFPIAGSRCSAQNGSSGVSKHYITRFPISEYRSVLLIGIHFIAFPDRQDRCAKREAQAKVIKELIKENRKAGESVIVAGDFNDFDNDFLGADGQQSISQTLPILKQEEDGVELFNLLEFSSQKNRFSAWYDRNKNCRDDGDQEHSLLDHILVTRDLYDSLESLEFHHEYDASCASKVSDHWPVIATFRIE